MSRRTKTKAAAAAAASRAPAAATAAPARASLRPLVFSEASLSAAKWLAVVLMVVDHWNKYLLDGSEPAMYALGRISMPLFAFLVGYNLARPGMYASGAYRRMAYRLAIFGLLAAPPFVILNKLPLGWWPLNMMFALLIAVSCAWLWEIRSTTATIVACLLLAWGGALVEFWWPAIGLCLTVWAYQRRPSKALVACFLACLLLLYFVNWNLWALAVIPVLYALRWWPIALPRLKWWFYAFYPLHLAAFWLALQLRK